MYYVYINNLLFKILWHSKLISAEYQPSWAQSTILQASQLCLWATPQKARMLKHFGVLGSSFVIMLPKSGCWRKEECFQRLEKKTKIAQGRGTTWNKINKQMKEVILNHIWICLPAVLCFRDKSTERRDGRAWQLENQAAEGGRDCKIILHLYSKK